jgi:hypothetical protein
VPSDFMNALLGRPHPVAAEGEHPSTPIPPEGGFRTSPPVPTNPVAEHSQMLGSLLATRRLESEAKRQ